MKKSMLLCIAILAVLGLLDSSYLVWEHYNQALPPCSTHWWVDCGKVLQSEYSQWWGIPVAAFGMLQYSLMILLGSTLFISWKRKISWWLLMQATAGFSFSLYFVFVQLFVLQAICLYCMASAAISTTLFLLTVWMVRDLRAFGLWVLAMQYQVLKRLLFLIDAETVHEQMVKFGETLGKSAVVKKILKVMFAPNYPMLTQDIAGVTFATPIGLAAGFDYEARLTQILSSIGFGFQTVGTISNQPCEGNKKPRLGRLPKSKSLLVNKGFRNPGAVATARKLSSYVFDNAIGVSIGQTNTRELNSLAAVINDILDCFRKFEKSSVKHSYYELNISCPNLHSEFNFYQPENLELLLKKIETLHLTRPVFIKMPISESDGTILSLLKVIVKSFPVGIIIGNLQKYRTVSAVVESELNDLGPGGLSGKPTFDRSNYLIALCYKYYGKKLVIIGCGGVFTPEDAYLKISLGASLIQLITGMVFQGPQCIAQINQGLVELLHQDGYTSLQDSIGKQNKKYFGKENTHVLS